MPDIFYKIKHWYFKKDDRSDDIEFLNQCDIPIKERYMKLRVLGIPPHLARKHCKVYESGQMIGAVWNSSNRKKRKRCEELDQLDPKEIGWLSPTATIINPLDTASFPYLKGLEDHYITKLGFIIYLFENDVSTKVINEVIKINYPNQILLFLELMKQYDKKLEKLFIYENIPKEE